MCAFNQDNNIPNIPQQHASVTLQQLKVNLIQQKDLLTKDLEGKYLVNVQQLIAEYNRKHTQLQNYFNQQINNLDTLLNQPQSQQQIISIQPILRIPPSITTTTTTTHSHSSNTFNLSNFPIVSINTNTNTNSISSSIPQIPQIPQIPPMPIIQTLPVNNNKKKKKSQKPIHNKKNKRVLINKVDINSHIRDERRKYHRCNGCNTRFLDKDELFQHKNASDPKKAYKCRNCCKSFSRLGNLHNHNKIHTSSNKDIDTDNNENNENNDTITVNIDNNNINNNKPYSCNECCKSFRNKSGLSNHKIIHSGAKPHNCVFYGCGKAFARSCDLTRHIRLHTGDKPFKCHQQNCSKSFTRSVQLRLHLMDHSGQRPFKCDLCKKGFKTLQNAQIHMRIHTGEKPFQCRFCKKKFTQSSSLKTHVQSIH